MKKDSFSSFRKVATVSLVLIGLVFAGCEKEIQNEQTNQKNLKVINFNNFDLTVKNNMLSFATDEAYDEALTFLAKDEQQNFAEWNQKVDFVSLAKVNKCKKEELPVFDNIIANMLNSESLIEIQGKIFKLDFDKQIVLVFENHNAYLNDKCSKTYSFNDEVLTMEFGTQEEIESIKTTKATDFYLPSFRTWYNVGNTDVKYRIAYVKLGVYFTLYALIKKTAIQFGGTYVSVCASGYYKPKNKSKVSYDCDDYFAQGWGPIEYIARPWSSMRSLEYYYIEGFFHASSENVSLYDTWSH